MSGVNGNVIMSGWDNGHHPDNATTKRIEIIERALRTDLTVIEAAMVLGVSERQCYRLKKRIKDQGVKGVIPTIRWKHDWVATALQHRTRNHQIIR